MKTDNSKKVMAALLLLTVVATIFQPSRVLASEATLSFNVPAYTVEVIGDCDVVEIPGGDVLLEEGKPTVPYYPVMIEYSAGYRVQDVVLVDKSGLVNASGLRLPAVTLEPFASSGDSRIDYLGEWYPSKDYSWETWVNSDGNSTLRISIFCFHYNANTNASMFYSHFDFKVVYIISTVAITGLATDKSVYDPGEDVAINVFLNNSGEEMNVTVDATVRRYDSGEIVDEAPLRILQNVVGDATFSMLLDSQSYVVGDYIVEIILNDTSGNWLDKRTCGFRIGKELLNVTFFNAEPAHFKIGEIIQINMGISNVGSISTSGRIVIRIIVPGAVIEEFQQNFSSPSPGGSSTVTQFWNTSSAEKGKIYYILGFVSYSGQSTQTKSVKVSTNLSPIASFNYLPTKVGMGENVTFNASSSSDLDGSLSSRIWEFGDGGNASGEVATHSYYEAGEYIVTLTVVDNEGATSSNKTLVTVMRTYYLNVTSNIGVDIGGSGRYLEGVKVQLIAPKFDMPGITGLLGGKYVFKQWKGAVDSAENPMELTFAGYELKLTAQAIYEADYSSIYLIASLTMVAVAIIVIAARKLKNRQNLNKIKYNTSK